MASDRRRDPRCPIDLLVNKYIDGEPHACRAVNVSRRGMLLHKLFEPATAPGEVMLEFQLPGLDRLLHVDGVVLAEHPLASAHAVRFRAMSDLDAAALEAFLGSGVAPATRQAKR